VHDNPELRDFVIAGRQANVTARALSLLRNPKLQTAEIVNIDSVRGTLRISGSPLLQDLQFDLRTVGGDLYLYETGLRNTLDFFYLVFVGGDLEVKRNPVLRDECVSDLFDWVTTAGEEIASENGGPLPCYGP
jgi:hypothetical protein